jgi:hypothetical protein
MQSTTLAALVLVLTSIQTATAHAMLTADGRIMTKDTEHIVWDFKAELTKDINEELTKYINKCIGEDVTSAIKELFERAEQNIRHHHVHSKRQWECTRPSTGQGCYGLIYLTLQPPLDRPRLIVTTPFDADIRSIMIHTIVDGTPTYRIFGGGTGGEHKPRSRVCDTSRADAYCARDYRLEWVIDVKAQPATTPLDSVTIDIRFNRDSDNVEPWSCQVMM